MSRLDKMWDEGDMHAARSPIVDTSSGGEGNTQMGLETAVRARGRGEGRSRLVRFSLMVSLSPGGAMLRRACRAWPKSGSFNMRVVGKEANYVRGLGFAGR